jgi:hypothetical protein
MRIRNLFDPGSGIRDVKIRIPDPQHWLELRTVKILHCLANIAKEPKVRPQNTQGPTTKI